MKYLIILMSIALLFSCQKKEYEPSQNTTKEYDYKLAIEGYGGARLGPAHLSLVNFRVRYTS